MASFFFPHLFIQLDYSVDIVHWQHVSLGFLFLELESQIEAFPFFPNNWTILELFLCDLNSFCSSIPPLCESFSKWIKVFFTSQYPRTCSAKTNASSRHASFHVPLRLLLYVCKDILECILSLDLQHECCQFLRHEPLGLTIFAETGLKKSEMHLHFEMCMFNN